RGPWWGGELQWQAHLRDRPWSQGGLRRREDLVGGDVPRRRPPGDGRGAHHGRHEDAPAVADQGQHLTAGPPTPRIWPDVPVGVRWSGPRAGGRVEPVGPLRATAPHDPQAHNWPGCDDPRLSLTVSL